MKNDMQRVRVIEKFLKDLSKEDVQAYARKDFKVRIGAEYGVGKGEVASFTFVEGFTDYTWNVTFKRTQRIFRASWNNGEPTICWWRGEVQFYCPQCGRPMYASDAKEDSDGNKWVTCGWCYEKVSIEG